MRNEIETIFRATDRVSRTLGRIRTNVARFSRGAARSLKRIDAVNSKIHNGLKRVAIAFGIVGVAVGGVVAKLMQEFSKIEDAEAAFTPVLGGAKKAKEMVDALNQTAATTPFQFENLAGAAKQLLPNMGGDIAKTVGIIRMLGDTAGGQAGKMDSIVRGYNKALLKGKVDMESLNMIAEAGVPIFQSLGEVMNLEGEKMFKTISSGKVQTVVLTEALKKMASEGGMFYRGMEIASKTLSGKISTLKDNISLTAAEIGSVLAPALKELVDKLTGVAQQAKAWFVQNKELIKSKLSAFIKGLVDNLPRIIYWGKKILAVIAIFYAFAGAVKVFNAVMLILNAVMMANPITLIAVAVGLAIAAFILFSDEVDAFIEKYFGVKDATEKIKNFFVETWNWVRDYYVGLFTAIKDYVTIWVRNIQDILALFTAVFSGDWETAGELVMALWGRMRGFFEENFGGMVSFIQGVVDTLQDVFSVFAAVFSRDWETAGELLIGIWNRIKAAAKSVFDWVADKLSFLMQGIRKVAGVVESLGLGASPAGAVSPKVSALPPPALPGGIAGMSVPPSVSVATTSRSEQVSREETEITIKDETGRARITRGGRPRNLKLVHTGGLL